MFMKVQDTTDLAASLLVAVRGDEGVRFDRDSSFRCFREAVISDNPGDETASRFEEGRRSTKSTLLNRSVHTKLSWRYKVCAVGEIAETVGNAERSAFRGSGGSSIPPHFTTGVGACFYFFLFFNSSIIYQ